MVTLKAGIFVGFDDFLTMSIQLMITTYGICVLCVKEQKLNAQKKVACFLGQPTSSGEV